MAKSLASKWPPLLLILFLFTSLILHFGFCMLKLKRGKPPRQKTAKELLEKKKEGIIGAKVERAESMAWLVGDETPHQSLDERTISKTFLVGGESPHSSLDEYLDSLTEGLSLDHPLERKISRTPLIGGKNVIGEELGKLTEGLPLADPLPAPKEIALENLDERGMARKEGTIGEEEKGRGMKEAREEGNFMEENASMGRQEGIHFAAKELQNSSKNVFETSQPLEGPSKEVAQREGHHHTKGGGINLEAFWTLIRRYPDQSKAFFEAQINRHPEEYEPFWEDLNAKERKKIGEIREEVVEREDSIIGGVVKEIVRFRTSDGDEIGGGRGQMAELAMGKKEAREDEERKAKIMEKEKALLKEIARRYIVLQSVTIDEREKERPFLKLKFDGKEATSDYDDWKKALGRLMEMQTKTKTRRVESPRKIKIDADPGTPTSSRPGTGSSTSSTASNASGRLSVSKSQKSRITNASSDGMVTLGGPSMKHGGNNGSIKTQEMSRNVPALKMLKMRSPPHRPNSGPRPNSQDGKGGGMDEEEKKRKEEEEEAKGEDGKEIGDEEIVKMIGPELLVKMKAEVKMEYEKCREGRKEEIQKMMKQKGALKKSAMAMVIYYHAHILFGQDMIKWAKEGGENEGETMGMMVGRVGAEVKKLAIAKMQLNGKLEMLADRVGELARGIRPILA